MTTYYCKCGRIVRKSTDADNTGNRLEGYAPGHECFGCPYVLPFGENRYEEGKGFRLEVKGYECRMSKCLEYASRFSGSVSDKRTCSIVSLDFDFLERVSSWISENYPGGELNGRFDRSEIRPVEYSSNGRYRLTIACAQNKAGMAAKAALLAQFFNQDGSRKDLSPEDEKSWILANITAGKAADPGKETTPCAANPNPQSPTPAAAPSQSPSPGTAPGASTGTFAPGGRMYITDTGMIYGVRQKPDGVWRIMCHYAGDEWTLATDPAFRAECLCSGSLQEVLDAYALRKGWKEIDMECQEKNPKPALTAAAAATTDALAAAPEETLTTSESAEGAKTSRAWTSGAADAESMSDPSSPAAAAPVTQSLSDAGTAWLQAEPERPAFDYSGLDAQTVEDLHLAEREYKGGKRLVETGLRRMADAVAIAHDVLVANCDKHNNQHSEDNFRRFCADVLGISKDAAYRLLQVNKMFCNSSPKEQKILEVLSPSLLYAAAKPSAPAELVQGVKDGDITTHKQYQELLAQLKAKDDEVAAANAQRDAALKERDEAEAERDAARKEKAGLAADCNRLGKAASEKDARIRELESRPVEVVGATPEDIARWREEGAEKARRETQRELSRANAETAKERKRAEEAERERDECADTMEKYATQLGELRGRQEMTDSQLHAIYTAEKAAETCTMVICQALDEIYDLPRDLKAQAMNHLRNLHICLGKAISLGYWPTEDDLDEPDEWPEEDEDV